MEPIKAQHDIEWDPYDLHPIIQLKDGILRKQYLMRLHEKKTRGRFEYTGEGLLLSCRWQELSKNSSVLSLKLTNQGSDSVRITRLMFPAENGVGDFVKGFSNADLCFLRNGYQSWSTARSYRPHEKPLRPWLQMISQISSNMANLPSNIPGVFSSEMFTVISDKEKNESFLVGQGASFRQFFYIKFNLLQGEQKSSYLELTYDFGRKLLDPGESIELDSIYMARGQRLDLQREYTQWIQKEMGIQPPGKALSGFGTWYYYYQNISPEKILNNLQTLKERKLPLDIFQIDDGYQAHVGDWLVQKPAFKGKMKELAQAIEDAGYRPGIWIAPFVTNSVSRLAKQHPDYLLRNEYGTKLIGGYSPFWKGRVFYGLDITYPRYEEYLRKVIRTIVHDWGYRYLKCDFLFGACLRGAIHYDIHLTRTEVLRRGMEIIREEAGKYVLIEGCGMPLVPGVGLVDLMRVGPDTGPFWTKNTGKLLRTGAMMGVRNALRNSFVRSMLHRRFWINDPDCLMLREVKTRLNPKQRRTHINGIILTGGFLQISDDLALLSEENWKDFDLIKQWNQACFEGELSPVDLMDREIPELLYNTAGFLGIFNMGSRKRAAGTIELPSYIPEGTIFNEVWTQWKAVVNPGNKMAVPELAPYESLLFHSGY